MKKFILLMVLPTAIIACNNGDLQQARLTQMCDCMEKNQEAFTNPLTAAAMGSYTNTTLASSTALACAQQVLGSENSTDLKAIHLFTIFQKTECGAKFGIDVASINKAESDAKQALSNLFPKPQQEKSLHEAESTLPQTSTTSNKEDVPLIIKKASFIVNGESGTDINIAYAASTSLLLQVNKSSSDWDGKNIEFGIKVFDPWGNTVSGKGLTDGYFLKDSIYIDDSILPMETSSSSELSKAFRLDLIDYTGGLEAGEYRMEIWCESRRIYTTNFNITW